MSYDNLSGANLGIEKTKNDITDKSAMPYPELLTPEELEQITRRSANGYSAWTDIAQAQLAKDEDWYKGELAMIGINHMKEIQAMTDSFPARIAEAKKELLEHLIVEGKQVEDFWMQKFTKHLESMLEELK